LCGSQDNLQRVAIKQMLTDWERRFPGRLEAIATGLRNVVVSHLADPRAFDFAALGAGAKTGDRDMAGVIDEDLVAGELEPREEPLRWMERVANT
jgi:tRNA 2-thiocytidine biosynthesis protein TtcA